MDDQGRIMGQWTLRMLCALALLFVGFAHQPPALAAQTENFEAFRLPDGSLPTLCITVFDDGKGTTDHKVQRQGCEACRISASVLLPTPGDAAGMFAAFDRHAPLRQRHKAYRRQIYPPNTGPRAPPSAPILT